MTQTVEFYTTKVNYNRQYSKESFELRRDRPLIYLQRLAIWVLKRLGCYSFIDVPICSRTVVHTKTLLENLFRQQSELLSLYCERGERLLIGPEEFQQFVGSDCPSYTSFHVPMYGPAQICGLDVTVIPWMKGMLVIPKEK